ncbi:hypothetical protein [Streptomyces albicerus]|jgi:hypothetical protein|uniref:hypothetical protein n=1 Tax=Streptomyces albicerus TaxID=2569859 RepID=UPI001788D5E0|nr:hypothetical protein [Streptomyces albicerus]
MKTLKAAAVVVGSLAIAGVTVPAAAGDMPAQGLLDNGKMVAGSLPSAAKVPTGFVAENARETAHGVKDGVKERVNESGIVKTPVFGGTLPNPIDGKLLGGLPVPK